MKITTDKKIQSYGFNEIPSQMPSRISVYIWHIILVDGSFFCGDITVYSNGATFISWDCTKPKNVIYYDTLIDAFTFL